MKRSASPAREVSPPAPAPASVGCACSTLRRAARIATQLYDEALAPTGLRITQYALLARVERQGPIAMTALAQALAMDRTTLTRNLAPLRRAGLLRLDAAGAGRTKLVSLTKSGGVRLREALPYWERAQRRYAETALAQAARELATLAEALRAGSSDVERPATAHR